MRGSEDNDDMNRTLSWLLWDKPSTTCLCAAPRAHQPETRFDSIFYRVGLVLLLGVLTWFAWLSTYGYWTFMLRSRSLMRACLLAHHTFDQCYLAFVR